MDCFALLASYAPTGFLDERDGLRASVANVPLPLFNQVAAIGDTVPEAVVEDALDAWVRRCERLGVLVRRGPDEVMARVCRRRGMITVDAFPGMVATRLRQTHRPRGLHLAVMRGPDAVEAHLDLMGRAFDMTPDLLEAIFPPGVLDDPRVIVSIGTVDDEPVTTALGVMSEDVVTLFNVATPREHRGRRYGTAVTAHVANEGRRRGARLTALQSTEAGFPVYRRLGFETVVEYEVWSAADPA